MKDPVLFQMQYVAVPDYGEIISRCEFILSSLNQVES